MPDVKLQKGFSINDKIITPIAIMNYFWAVWDQSNSYFEDIIKPDWDRNEELYRDKFRQNPKQVWQSEVQIPVVDQLVTRITQFFVRTLVNTFEGFFQVKHADNKKAQAYTAILKAILRDNKYAEETFAEALAYAWTNALYCTKTYWCTEDETYPSLENDTLSWNKQAVSKVKIEVINPRNIRLDPNGDQYIIEHQEDIPFHTFMRIGKKAGWSNLQYVKEAMFVADIDESDAIDNTGGKYLPTVDIDYVYTKALTDEHGELLCEDVYFVVVNRDYVVDFGYNMGINGDTPYTVHNPMLDVYGRYGRPYISKLRSLIQQYVNVVNLMVDSAILSGLGTHELNRTLLDPAMAHTVTRDIDPGLLLSKRGDGKLLESTYPPNGVVQSILQVAYFFQQQIQEHSYQTEFFDGQNSSRGRKTATEIQTKTQMTNTFFTDIATQIENYSVKPTIEKALYTYLIHMDDPTTKDLAQTISDEAVRGYFLSLSHDERIQDIRELQIEVRGISGRLQTQNDFNKVVQLLSVLGNFGITQGLTQTKLIDKAFEVVDNTPDEFFDMDLLRQLQEQLANGQPTNAPPTQPGGAGLDGKVAGGSAQPPDAVMAKAMAEQGG